VDWRIWRHAVKIDPARPLPASAIAGLAATGTDALILGGSDGIRRSDVERLLDAARSTGLPVAIEVSDLEAAVPGADLYFIPMVLNTRDPRWLVGAHREALQRLGPYLPWERVVTEAYIVCNPASTVARVSAAAVPASAEEVAAWAAVGDRLLRAGIVYIEYSGRFGDPAWVRAAAEVVRGARLFYGGGITGGHQAATMAAIADTVVVGNVLYRADGLRRIRQTVRAVRDVRAEDRGGERFVAGDGLS